MSRYILPITILIVLGFALKKKTNIYNSFCEGAKAGFNLVIDIIPYICAIMLVIALMRYSGLGDCVIKLLAPFMSVFGVPSELCEFIMLRPFSGSGSIALLKDIIATYGADSKVARIASIIMGSSETVFFVSALYFSKTTTKNVGKVVCLILLVNFIGVVLSCFLANLM